MQTIHRRELVRIGGLSLAGLTLSDLLTRSSSAAPAGSTAFGRAKNVIFLYLNGGPPQHETFDPKPHAPSEIRGVFQPIQTNVAGIHFGELLPRTAGLADKLAVVRSMATDDNIHSSSGHWVLTGSKYQGPNARTIQTSDWPYFGSIVKRYRPSPVLPALSTVMIPDVIRLNENVTPAGQTGGVMGSRWSPERFVGDPSRPDYRIEGLEPLGVSLDRVRGRRSLLQSLDERLRDAENGRAIELLKVYQRQAFDLLTSGKAREAFAISKEPDRVRERYGRNRWGQCVLLARRLVEAGVRLVHVNWPREPGDNAVDNPLWDTHAQNHDRLEDVLCPMFDVGFSTLIRDLDERGLLEETLVVAIGEFGRTPKINGKAGRDHWGPVFSFVMAGAGIRGGQVYGSSDRDGAYPKSDRVDPGHLTATIFHLLGLDHRRTFTDPEGRELPFTKQSPLYSLLGERAAHREARTTGDPARVPPFDEKRILARSDFAGRDPVLPADAPSRPKGWRSRTSLLKEAASGFGVRLARAAKINDLELPQHLTIGFENLSDDAADQGENILVAQEVRSPFAGAYELTIHYLADADSQASLTLLERSLEFRLVYLQFTNAKKQIDAVKELGAKAFPLLQPERKMRERQSETFHRTFSNPTPGGNFSFGLGLAVGVSVRRRAKPMGTLPRGSAVLRLLEVQLKFLGKERNQDVTV